MPEAGTRFPRRSGRRQSLGDHLVVVPAGTFAARAAPAHQGSSAPGAVDEFMPDQQLVLAASRELRPARTHRRVHVGLPPAGEDLRAQCGRPPGQRHQHRPDLRRPRLARPGRGTPRIDHRHPARVGADRAPASTRSVSPRSNASPAGSNPAATYLSIAAHPFSPATEIRFLLPVAGRPIQSRLGLLAHAKPIPNAAGRWRGTPRAAAGPGWRLASGVPWQPPRPGVRGRHQVLRPATRPGRPRMTPFRGPGPACVAAGRQDTMP
jgi:hypothetical protein